ncbi:MAG: hypothetical protein K0S75_2180, partial [Clostridia bacterium]|nr:hypothetical protein [Clostridia bacterium]
TRKTMSETKCISLFTKAIQIDHTGEKNEIEFFVEGTYAVKNDSLYITYKESEISGMEGTTTTLKITDHSLSIIRFGTYNSKLDFKHNEETITNYQTPYGNIPIIINTRLLEIDMKQGEKSTIHLKYTLNTEGEEPINNEVIISYK